MFCAPVLSVLFLALSVPSEGTTLVAQRSVFIAGLVLLLALGRVVVRRWLGGKGEYMRAPRMLYLMTFVGWFPLGHVAAVADYPHWAFACNICAAFFFLFLLFHLLQAHHLLPAKVNGARWLI